MSILLTCAALAFATVLVAAYVSAQHHRLRVLEARIAAAKTKLLDLHDGPTVKRTEVLLQTTFSEDQNCGSTLRPHYRVAKIALRNHPGCTVRISNLWEGRDEQVLDVWFSTKHDREWVEPGTCTTTMTWRFPVPPKELSE